MILAYTQMIAGPDSVEMKDVVKFYAGDKPVLNGVSFRIFRGETKIIIGASGSGKSTILKLIMGLDKPDEGQILVEGQDITRMNEQELVGRPAENRDGVSGIGALRFYERSGECRLPAL